MFNGHLSCKVSCSSLKSKEKSANFHKIEGFGGNVYVGRLPPGAASGHFVLSPLFEAQWSAPSHLLETISELVKLLFCISEDCDDKFIFHSLYGQQCLILDYTGLYYLLIKSDDDHVDNNVEKKVGD